MLNRRRFTAGVAALAAGSTARARSRAQSGRPLVVFLGLGEMQDLACPV